MHSIRIIGVSIWVLVNLTLLGLLVYIYLLWSVYWKMASSAPHAPLLETSVHKSAPASAPWQLLGRATAGGRPRYFWNDTIMLSRLAVPTDKLGSRIDTYKQQLVVKLRQSSLDAANVLNVVAAAENSANAYNVQYQGNKKPETVGAETLMCELARHVHLRFLDAATEPFRRLGLGSSFPSDSGNAERWAPAVYNSCAVVSSAGSLYRSSLGKQIDGHDAVLRFNSAPTEGFEDDVGAKTTFRILNSQVVSKPEFNFLTAPLYKNITIFAWDPSNYTVDLEQWYQHPDFDLFTPYFKHRELYPGASFYILHPQMIWDSWSFLQHFSGVPIMRHPPSSGFLGLVMMAHLCSHVHIYEYIPSMRLTKRCHYFDIHDNSACTFGTWHPLASEKLLALAMHIGTDADVFDTGMVRLRGTALWDCPAD